MTLMPITLASLQGIFRTVHSAFLPSYSFQLDNIPSIYIYSDYIEQ